MKIILIITAVLMLATQVFGATLNLRATGTSGAGIKIEFVDLTKRY